MHVSCGECDQFTSRHGHVTVTIWFGEETEEVHLFPIFTACDQNGKNHYLCVWQSTVESLYIYCFVMSVYWTSTCSPTTLLWNYANLITFYLRHSATTSKGRLPACSTCSAKALIVIQNGWSEFLRTLCSRQTYLTERRLRQKDSLSTVSGMRCKQSMSMLPAQP